MKLNIGCGYNYLRGYVNLDASRDSLADKFMEAHQLGFDDGSAEEIKASQLIEHLGFFRTKYFLAECYRVLKDGGVLTLETPHIEKTFRVFLKGPRAAREAALGWVYGSECPGMEHRYCFPAELLRELLAGAGFELKKKKFFEYQPHCPALRLTARKKGSPAADFEAALRREIAVEGAAPFRDEYAASELEKLIKAALSPGIFKNDELAFELALYDPGLAGAFFRVKGGAKFIKAAAALAAANFTARMYGALAAQPLDASQHDAFEAALESGRRDLKEVLAGRLPPAEKPCPQPLFSLEMTRRFSERTVCAGLKAYENAAFGEAADYFAQAVHLCRDNPYAWLYFARSFEARSEYNECAPAYEKALALFERSGLAGPEMVKNVKKELDNIRRRRCP